MHEACRNRGPAPRLHRPSLTRLHRGGTSEAIGAKPALLPIPQAAAALPGAKDGSGIGPLVDEPALWAWIEEHRTCERGRRV